MKKQREVTETYCDGCGKWHEMPLVIVGRYDSGWEHVHDMDLCPVCVKIVSNVLIENSSKGVITDIVQDIQKNMPKTGLNIELNPAVYTGGYE